MSTSPSPYSPYSPSIPCANWAGMLAAPVEHLTDTERAALDRHVAGCSACATVREEYRRMDAQIRALPAPHALDGLPPALLDLWAREDGHNRQDLSDIALDSGEAVAPDVPRPAEVRLPHRTGGVLRALAAVVILGALLGGYYAVIAGHSRTGTRTTLGTVEYGPLVDPAGPRAHVGAWRMVTLPPGTPDRAQQAALPGASGGQPTGGVQIYEHPAVAGLLYAVSPPAGVMPLRMWRSDDAGHTWKPLALPPSAAALPAGESAILVVFDARDPDTVLFWGFNLSTVSSVRLYSLNRGATWHTLQMPPGSDAWNVTLPMADRGAWYLPVWVAAQPAIWISRDHGATWTAHAYPVRVPNRAPGQPDQPAGTLLTVDYMPNGGLLWAYQRTLWWSPDDGATWRRHGTWGAQPCDGEIAGTGSLSVLYCLFSNGATDTSKPLDQRPIWRSEDGGQTWVPIPGGPPVAPLASDPTGGTSPAIVLGDGSLLVVAPSRERPDELAFYTLSRGSNVWHEASAPLPPPWGYCLLVQSSSPTVPSAIAPECATPLQLTVTSGPTIAGKTSQLVYLTHAAANAVTNPVYVATITWS